MSPVTSLLKNCLAVTSLLGMSVFQLDPKTFHNLWHIFAHIFVPLSFHTYIYIYYIYISVFMFCIYIYSPIDFHTVYYIPIYFTIENRFIYIYIYIDIWIMVSKENHPQITLFQVSELLSFARIFPTGIAADIAADSTWVSGGSPGWVGS